MSVAAPSLARLGVGARLPLIGLVLGVGLVLRVVLAFVVFPGQGLASDLGLFESWALSLAQVGPGSFYESARMANYPPGYMYVLWAVGLAGQAISGIAGVPAERVVDLLLKVPVILADLAVAVLLYRAGRRWFGEGRGILAAALYLLIPVTWYDSAIWGQVDAAVALVMIAAIILLIEGWTEPAAALAVLSVLVKPQGLVVLVVVAPVLLRRHLLRVGSGPVPVLGPRLAAVNRRLDGLLTRQGPERLVSVGRGGRVDGDRRSAAIRPRDTRAGCPRRCAGDRPDRGPCQPGHRGCEPVQRPHRERLQRVGIRRASAARGIVLRWGGRLDARFDRRARRASRRSRWEQCCSSRTAVLVAVGLLLQDGRLRIVLALTLMAFAFYALPTRVHERYLFPMFASGALLVAGIAPLVWYVVTGLLNAVNLHAVLTLSGGSGGPAGGGAPTGGGIGGRGGFGGGFGGGPGGGASSVRLPFGDLAHSEVVIAAVAVGQSVLFVMLLATWLAVMIRPGLLGRDQPEAAAR